MRIFKTENTLRGASRTLTARFKKQTYTVTVKAAEWLGGRWTTSADAEYAIGWLDMVRGSSSISRDFLPNETCTFWYGMGSASSGSGYYEPMEICDQYHNRVSGLNSSSEFSFTVTNDVTYYVSYSFRRYE